MDFLTATRAPRACKVGGQTWRIAPRSISDWADFQALVADTIPGPLERTLQAIRRLERVGTPPPPSERREMIERATDKEWPPYPMSREWGRCLNHPGMIAAFLHWAISPNHPEFTPEDAARLARTASYDEVAAAGWLAYGKVAPGPDDGQGGDPDPKAPDPTPSAGAGSSSPSPGAAKSAAGTGPTPPSGT